MLSESEIRDRIARVLAGDLPLDDFSDWLASNSWNMHKSASQDVQHMVGAIQLALAERANGHESDVEVLNLLRSFVVPERLASPSGLQVEVFVYKVSRRPAVFFAAGSSNSINQSAPSQSQNQRGAELEDLLMAEA